MNESDLNFKYAFCNYDHLKAKLKTFSFSFLKDKNYDNLTKNEKTTILSLKNNNDIVIKRPDKGGGVVILNRSDYEDKLQAMLNDTTKFKITSDKTNSATKNNINRIAYEIKNKTIQNKIKRIGFYNLGHIYGLPKIHKNPENPPLRPVISMCGTVTHEIAQYLNSIIRPYLNNSFIVKSNNESLCKLSNLKLGDTDVFASLDVESLFTNVPVLETIDIIINNIYHSNTMSPSEISEQNMRNLLLICSTQTPFKFKENIYLQIDGVSMGSPLGPTFTADFYMANLENKILSENNNFNPVFYIRYVDDTLTIFKNLNNIHQFINRLQELSCLKFTYETCINNTINFLDIKITVNHDGTLSTGIHVKPTDNGMYMNYGSYSPNIYKTSIVKTLVYRAYNICSDWTSFDKEITRIRQNFINSDHPQYLIENLINKTLSKLYVKENNNNQKNNIKFFFKTQNANDFDKEEKSLRNILSTHIKPIDNNKIKVKLYHKSK